MATNNKCVIVVEGKTDMHVVLHLLNKINPGNDPYKNKAAQNQIVVKLPGGEDLQIELFEAGDIDLLQKVIGVKMKESDLSCIGFVFDADSDPQGRWYQIRNKILEVRNELEKNIPPTPISKGVCAKSHEHEIVVGMWMMPNNKDRGAIENFLSYMIPKNDLWTHAQKYVGEVPRRLFKKQYTMRAKVHAWLAVQKEPGKPPGTAIKAKFLNACAPEAKLFQNWLKKLQQASNK